MWRYTVDKILVKGGNSLSGSVSISSAKNAYLPILAGAVLCSGEVVLHKFPKYDDVINMIEILENLGGKSAIEDGSLILNMKSLSSYEIPRELASLTRSSIFSLGSILGRFRFARVAYPGGCEIGARPIDLHIKGLEALNVKVVDRRGYLTCDGRNMHAGNVHLDFPSVGATENVMMAAVLTKGRTKIFNAAKEPEIVDLQNFLNKAGAKIRGAGTTTITIDGVEKLGSVEYTPVPDRIIAGTYLIATIMCGGDVLLENARPEHLQALISKFDNNSCKIVTKSDRIRVISNGRPKSINKIETMPYPGFPTDLQPQIMALQTISNGTSVIIENLFETRFKHVTELVKMGAQILTEGRSAVIKGVEKLYGAEVTATDLRGGAGLVLAGLVADGYTTISNIGQIKRGYESIESDLKCLGADIKKMEFL